jgi:hypothetical protein
LILHSNKNLIESSFFHPSNKSSLYNNVSKIPNEESPNLATKIENSSIAIEQSNIGENRKCQDDQIYSNEKKRKYYDLTSLEDPENETVVIDLSDSESFTNNHVPIISIEGGRRSMRLKDKLFIEFLFNRCKRRQGKGTMQKAWDDANGVNCFFLNPVSTSPPIPLFPLPFPPNSK